MMVPMSNLVGCRTQKMPLAISCHKNSTSFMAIDSEETKNKKKKGKGMQVDVNKEQEKVHKKML